MNPAVFPRSLFAAVTDYFINGSLLALCGLAVIPVILHFLLRNKPKKLIFPALRLLQLRRKQNVRKLRLKHLWLLLLRIGVILFLVLAIARPTLPAADYTPNSIETATIFAVIACCLAGYYGALHYFRKQQPAQHVLAYRRIVLRGVTGGVMTLLLLLLFVWPYANRVFAELNSPLSTLEKNLPVTAVFVFDESLSMSYEHGNEKPTDHNTRLKVAQEIARQHHETFRSGSRVSVMSTSGNGRVLFLTDREAVRGRIKDLKITPLGKRSLDDLVRKAIERQKSDRENAIREFSDDRYLREIYIFTDLAKNGWNQSSSKGISDLLRDSPWLRVYVIDVGIEKPTNVAVTSLSLSKQVVRPGEQVFVDVKLAAVGEGSLSGRLKLNLFDPVSRQKVTRDQKPVSIDAGTDQTVQLSFVGTETAFTQGEIEFEPGPDCSKAFIADDVRYFTVAVQPRPKVLIVSDSRSEAFLWQQSLSPITLLPRERWFLCEYRPTSTFLEEDLSSYNLIYLINVRSPSEKVWEKLSKYVNGGGGLGVVLGIPAYDGRTQLAYGTKTAEELLPAKVEARLSFVPPETLNLAKMDHPVLSTFKEYGSGDLTRMRVRKYWKVIPREKSQILATYTHPDSPPALVVRKQGDGHVAMLTTSIGGRGDWNDLRSSGWAYVELSHRLTQYLTGQTGRAYQFEQGEPVRLQIDTKKFGLPTMLRKPKTQVRIPPPPAAQDGTPNRNYVLRLTERQTNELGNYQLSGAKEAQAVAGAFSMNVASEETDLTRMTTLELDRILGEGQYQLARDIDGLNRAVNAGRYGIEIFDLAMLVLILVFCGELFVSNRFYEADQPTEVA